MLGFMRSDIEPFGIDSEAEVTASVNVGLMLSSVPNKYFPAVTMGNAAPLRILMGTSIAFA